MFQKQNTSGPVCWADIRLKIRNFGGVGCCDSMISPLGITCVTQQHPEKETGEKSKMAGGPGKERSRKRIKRGERKKE